MTNHPEHLNIRDLTAHLDDLADVVAQRWPTFVGCLSVSQQRLNHEILGLVRDELVSTDLNPDNFVRDEGQKARGEPQWWAQEFVVGQRGRPEMCAYVSAALAITRELAQWCALTDGMIESIGGFAWCANRVLAEQDDPDAEVVDFHGPGGWVWQALVEEVDPAEIISQCNDSDIEALFAHCIIDSAMLVLRMGLEASASIVDELSVAVAQPTL